MMSQRKPQMREGDGNKVKEGKRVNTRWEKRRKYDENDLGLGFT